MSVSTLPLSDSPRQSIGGQTVQKLTRILIVTDNPSASKTITAELRALYLDVQLSFFDGKKLSSTPRQSPDAILCYLTDYVEQAASVVAVLRAHFTSTNLPIIGALERPVENADKTFDTVLFAPMHASQIANRVSSMVRLGQMEIEIRRRMATLREDFGQDIALPDAGSSRPFRILFIGKATPGFMVIVNALQTKNVEVIAAFTSFSAFDYLHERTFDAVVMNAMEQSEPALTISETMRRNSRLYHVPTLFLVDPNNFRDQEKAYQKGARDIISVDATGEEISGRILELANYHRIHEQLKEEFSSLGGAQCVDPASGLFNSDFFAAHLPRIVRDCKAQAQPLSLVALQAMPVGFDDVAPGFLNDAFAKTGKLIKNLVRMQDVVCRTEAGRFLLAFPEADRETAEKIVERVNGLMDCAAYPCGPDTKASFTLEMRASIGVLEDYMDSDMLIGATIAGLES